MADRSTAPVSPKVGAMLAYLEKMCLRPEELSPDDVAPLRAAGLSDQAIEDAVYVCAAFSVIIRLADAFEFHVPEDATFDAVAPVMLARGYKM